MLPIVRNEKFGTFSFYGQLSGKLSELRVWATYSVLEISTSYRGLLFGITFEELASRICCTCSRQKLALKAGHVRFPGAICRQADASLASQNRSE